MSIHMRRFVAMMLFGALLVLLTACSGSRVPGQAGKTPTSTPIVRDATPTPIPSPTPTPTPLPTPEPTPAPSKPGVPSAPVSADKVIRVSLSQQWLYAYVDGELVFDHAVETGRPELPTPTGTFTVLEKVRNVTFTSPWPQGSPHY